MTMLTGNFLETVLLSPGIVCLSCDSLEFLTDTHFTGSVKGLEFDYSQNLIKLKDGGNMDWWFESAPSFFSGDMGHAYNATIEYRLQTLEWENRFIPGFDIVLISKDKFYSLGIKGLKKDGDSSVAYTARIHESTGWEFLYPKVRKGTQQSEVSRDDVTRCVCEIASMERDLLNSVTAGFAVACALSVCFVCMHGSGYMASVCGGGDDSACSAQ
jgi:hypothetical protein